jgi:hypothetical protein
LLNIQRVEHPHAVRSIDSQWRSISGKREGEVYRHVAMHGAPAEFAELRRRNPILRPGPSNVFSRLAVTKQTHQSADVRQSQAYLNRDQAAVEVAEVAGARTLLIVPMLKETPLT